MLRCTALLLGGMWCRMPRRAAPHGAARIFLSMIPKKLGPDLIRAGYRFSEKIMLQA
jgi:hypothetical protein